MPIDLDAPLRWESADADATAMLADLQGNILDGHGRKATRHLFLKFDKGQAAARTLLRTLAPQITSALKQLGDAKRFRETGVSGGPFIGCLLSSSGYAALGLGDRAPQPDDGGAFADGMLARAAALNDPPAAARDAAYRARIDAMILIGGDPIDGTSWDSDDAEQVETRLLHIVHPGATIVATEIGRAIFRTNPVDEGPDRIEGIEHFGYVDGRSQPLMLEELVEREANDTDGTSVWSPRFPIGQVLVPDPGSDRPYAHGSFFVFRKLEQDVAGFKAREAALGDDPALGAQGERSGAALVGRFEDGTPIVLQAAAGAHAPVMNNFTYAGDPDGRRCPLHAHIRKTNPRGDSVRLGATLEEERSHIMARRGMPYGRRDRVVDPSDMPSGGVGLMFMAFMRDLAEGFEFTQAAWANNPAFAGPDTGRDPIIGQAGRDPAVPLSIRHAWGGSDDAATPTGFGEFVRMKGGEYFFAPAISTLSRMR